MTIILDEFGGRRFCKWLILNCFEHAADGNHGVKLDNIWKVIGLPDGMVAAVILDMVNKKEIEFVLLPGGGVLIRLLVKGEDLE